MMHDKEQFFLSNNMKEYTTRRTRDIIQEIILEKTIIMINTLERY